MAGTGLFIFLEVSQIAQDQTASGRQHMKISKNLSTRLAALMLTMMLAISYIVLAGLTKTAFGDSTSPAKNPLAARRAAPQVVDEDADAAEVAIGERLFLETRFAQFFFANSGGNANAVLATGDPTMDVTVTTTGSLPGPFAGTSMNCRSCHLVDEQKGVPGGGNRTYADFAQRSPIPAREDGKRTTPRNSPPLVNASLPRPGFLLHFDGEFASGVDLVKGTFTGRNFGWLPTERDRAIAHIAHIIRHDDGSGDLAQAFGGAYRVVLAGTSPAIPPVFRLPPAYRIDVTRATDAQILGAVAAL